MMKHSIPCSFIAAAALTLALIGCGGDKETVSTDANKVAPPYNMLLIHSGTFIFGSNKKDSKGETKAFGFTEPLYENEHPQRTLHLDDFFIDQYEVSNTLYKHFTNQTHYDYPNHWIQSAYNLQDKKLHRAHLDNLRWIATDYFKLDRDTKEMDRGALLDALFAIQRQRDKLPVTGISWDDAYTYCRWLGKRLPTEQEWEKAARGPHGNEYPWGNTWHDNYANTGEQGEGEEPLVASASFDKDKSFYGVYDLGGNVSEWVNDWYQAYPGANYSSEKQGTIEKVIRGGGAGVGHYSLSSFFRSARREHAPPSTVTTDIGFRCAQSI